MKLSHALLFCGALAATACADDTGESSLRKAEIDQGAVEAGRTVSLSGKIGTVALPFEVAVPAVPNSDFEAEMQAAVSLVVSSDASGATADLAGGTLVDGNPAGPGEFAWSLNGARDVATLTFYNATGSGLTMKTGSGYTATMAVATNDYVGSVPAFSFPVSVN